MATNEFWRFIDAIAHALPFRKESLEGLLDVRLVQDAENEYFVFYRMDLTGRCPYPVTITGIDLRVKKNDPDHPGFLVLKVAGLQVTASDLRSRYPEGSFTPPPPGNLSYDPEYTIGTKELWGTLMFGVSSRTDRVKSISFHPGE